VVISFLFNIGYLVTGYFYMSSDDYDIDWTTAQSVLCLRLIGISYDYFDGSKPDDKVESDQKLNRLKNLPNIIEVLGFSYFYGAFFVGPQFPFRKYKQFASMKTADMPSPYFPALRCLVLGFIYLLVNTFIGGPLTPNYQLTQEFVQSPFYKRFIYHFVSSYFIFTKYLGIWLITEGASVLCGLGYDDKPANKDEMWNAVSNVKPYLYETTTNLTGIIGSFNISTNDWAKRYIFKRLKFLNNKNASFFFTAMFLALWHGIAPGYFMCFALELPFVEVERMLSELLKPVHVSMNASPVLRLIDHVICQFFRMGALFFAITPFEFKRVDRTLFIWSNISYWVLWGTAIVYVIYYVIRPKKVRRE